MTKHDPPLLYNIGRDPSESHQCTGNKPCYPLTTAEQHNNIIDTINNAIRQHMQGLDTRSITNQYSWYRVLPRPWLQMCCNFPACQCEEFVGGENKH